MTEMWSRMLNTLQRHEAQNWGPKAVKQALAERQEEEQGCL